VKNLIHLKALIPICILVVGCVSTTPYDKYSADMEKIENQYSSNITSKEEYLRLKKEKARQLKINKAAYACNLANDYCGTGQPQEYIYVDGEKIKNPAFRGKNSTLKPLK